MKRRIAVSVIAVVAIFAVITTAFAAVYPAGVLGQLPPMTNAVWGDIYLALGGFLLLRRPEQVLPRVMIGLGVVLNLASITQVASNQWVDVTGSSLNRLGVLLYLGLGLCIGLLIHLFPTGKPPSRGWRWLVRALVVGSVGLVAGQMLGLGPEDGVVTAIPAIFLGACYALGLVSSIPSLGARFWRSRDAERAQVKWFFLAVVVATFGWFTNSTVGLLLTVVLPPLAVTIALTRYHLYDIDRVVSRTASYAIVTGAVITTYVVLVATITRFLPDSSTLAVTIATLGAAVLFQPLLRTVRAMVDRRFDRTRYDAQHTADSFAITLKTTVDSIAVQSHLAAAVTTSLQPIRYSFWIKP